MKKIDPVALLIGLMMGISLALILFLTVNAEEMKPNCGPSKERCIQTFQETVTLVPLRIEPIFVPGLALGEPVKTQPTPAATLIIKEGKLTKSNGRILGPTNEETYYNLPMDKVVETMRRKGYNEEVYPYYIREDGVKMLGDYVIVAADLDIHPRGSVVDTSVGQGLVCDTGDFTSDLYDIAVNW